MLPRFLSGYWQFVVLPFGGGSNTNTIQQQQLTPTQEEAQKLALQELQRNAELQKVLGPAQKQAIQDLVDEQAVRTGGKVSDVMRPVEGAAPTKSLDQIMNELRGQFTTAARSEYNSETGLFTEIPATTDQNALAAEAKKVFGAQAPTTELDPEATAARQKRFEDLLARETTTQARSDRQAEIAAEISELQLADIKRGGAATPEQLALIGEATAAAQATGEADIERFRTDTLRAINEEVASASGLRPTDTPIVRLSERAGEESARQQGQLTSRLAETNAMARLNFPLAQSKLTADIGATQQSLGLAASQFQEQLNERARENRFRLFASPTSLGAGGSSLGFGSPGVSQTVGGGLTIGEVGQLAGGVGGLISAFGATAGTGTAVTEAAALTGALGSDRRLKRDIFRIGELPSGIPIYIFQYKGFEGWHIGVMADEIIGVVPEAVIEDETGYMAVRYDLLN